MDNETAKQIREREQGGANKTPAVEDGGGEAGGDGSGGLPVPSISRRHLGIVAVVVGVGVVLYLKPWQSDGDGSAASGEGSLDSARSEVDGTTEATIEDEEGEEGIAVQHDPNNPLAADADVTEEFRKRGILTTPDEEAA